METLATDAIVYADEQKVAVEAYEQFLRKWRKLHESVARSLEKGGLDLLTFFRYPKSQWKALRTTNAVERINQEFRRRIKTQGSFLTHSSVLVVLFGMVASGMIWMQKIHGWEDMPSGDVDVSQVTCAVEQGRSIGREMQQVTVTV